YLTRPHAAGPQGTRVRHGGEADIDLPWRNAASVPRQRHSLTAAPTLSLSGAGADPALNQVILAHAAVETTPEESTLLRLPQGDVIVSALRISVDDPAAFTAVVRTHIP